jgi:hypothetical protein
VKKCEKSKKKRNYICFKLCRAHSAHSTPYGSTCDAGGGGHANCWPIRTRKVKKGEKSEKSKITYLVSHLELPILPVPLESPPVMQEVMGMPIIGLLEKER